MKIKALVNYKTNEERDRAERYGTTSKIYVNKKDIEDCQILTFDSVTEYEFYRARLPAMSNDGEGSFHLVMLGDNNNDKEVSITEAIKNIKGKWEEEKEKREKAALAKKAQAEARSQAATKAALTRAENEKKRKLETFVKLKKELKKEGIDVSEIT
jgi:hypothetical protein